QQPAAAQLPALHHAVLARGDEPPPVRRRRQRPHGPGVAAEDADLLPRLDVPQPHRPVLPGRQGPCIEGGLPPPALCGPPRRAPPRRAGTAPGPPRGGRRGAPAAPGPPRGPRGRGGRPGPPEGPRRPSPLKATADPSPAWPDRVRRSLPDSTSQRRTVRSCPP